MLLRSLVALTAALSCVAASPGYVHHQIEKRKASKATLAKRQEVYGPLLNVEGSEYGINVTVGTPKQKIYVTFDTGSSDFWVPASGSDVCEGGCEGGTYKSSDSSTYNLVSENGFKAEYGSGSAQGNWITESMTVSDSETLTNVTMAEVTSSEGFESGIFGVGPVRDETTSQPYGNASYPNALQHMVDQGQINRRAFSMYLNDVEKKYGGVCFGCVDTTKYDGELIALPMQNGPDSDKPYAYYVTLTEVAFIDANGNVSKLSPDDYHQDALLDSGTTLTYINNDIFQKIATGMGAVYTGSQEYTVPCSYGNSNASFRYTFGGPDGPSILVPMSNIIAAEDVSEDDFKHKDGGGCVLPIDTSGDAGDVILGDSFLRNAYIVYDQDNSQIAMAQAAINKLSTSAYTAIPTGTSIPGVNSTARAFGTPLAGSALTAQPTGISVETGNDVTAGTPTFSLGATATSKGAYLTASAGNPDTSTSHGLGVMKTPAPQAALLGALAAGAMLL